MNKNTVVYTLLGVIIGVTIMCIMIFSAKKQLEPTAKNGVITEEVIKEGKAPAEPGYALSQSIFPADDEVKINIKMQLERQQTLDRMLAERNQLAIEVRKNVEASLNEQSVSMTEGNRSAGESQSAAGQSSTNKTAASSSKQAPDPMLKKIRIEKIKLGEYRIHHY